MKTTTESDTLRRCMKLLGYTNKSLADELSSVRMDDMRTSEATVSRWISGAASPEPSLVLYLREKMRTLMTESDRHFLSSPLWVAVNGYKGGCGNSSMTNCLAVAAHQFGFKVGHVISHKDCHNPFSKSVENLAVFSSTLKFFSSTAEAINASEEEHFDFFFVDMPRDAFSPYEGRNVYDFERPLSKKIEALVCPTSFASWVDYSGLLKSLRLREPVDISSRVIVPFNKSISLIDSKEGIKDFEEWEELIHHDCLLFEKQPFDVEFESISLSIKFKDDYSWERYLSVISEILKRSRDSSLDELPDVNNMNLSELVALKR